MALSSILKTCPHLPIARLRDLSGPGGLAGFLDRIRAFSSWQREAQRYWVPGPLRPFIATRAWTLMAHAPEDFPALVRLLDRIEAADPNGCPAWELRHRFFRALARPVGPAGLNAVRSADWDWVLGMGSDVAAGLEAEIQAFMTARWSSQALASASGTTVIDRAQNLVGEWLEGASAVRPIR